MDTKLKIIYEDNEILVCDKPCGIPVQSRTYGKKDLEGMVKKELLKRGELVDFLSAVHRIDQPVEGLVLLAKNRNAMAHLSNQVKQHTIDKYYLAIVEGTFNQKKATLTDYLKKDGHQNYTYVVDKTDKKGKKSQLIYQVLESHEKHQLLEIHLLTGRHHQIRVQLNHAGHPIVGDIRYHSVCQNMDNKTQLALCSYKLVIAHPITGERLYFLKKPEGENFQEFSERIRKL